MNRLALAAWTILWVLSAPLWWHRVASAEPPPVGPRPTTTSAPADVRSITLPVVPFELPAGPGRQTVLARCAACHTSRYITIQPRFSREVWANEVAKMRKTFGAPVADEQVDEILDYLVSVRGAKE